MRGARPSVASDEWNCFELMLELNTPGQSDGEFAVWINDQLIQHLREGAPNMDRMGGGWWGPDPNGEPFPGFNWRDTEDLGFNWIWLDFYVDSGPSSMSWGPSGGRHRTHRLHHARPLTFRKAQVVRPHRF